MGAYGRSFFFDYSPSPPPSNILRYNKNMAVEVNSINSVFVAAHELKAPLCLLRQLALALDLTDDDPATAKQLKTQLVNVSERALRQVNDLTKVARLEDGLFTMEPVSVRGVCDEVWREISQLYRFEQHELALHYTNKSKLALANRDLLYSIIYNFCTNALHYSSGEAPSQLIVQDHQNHIRIKVRDYGPALPAKIWRALQSGSLSAPTPVAMRPDSTGLGLYIASEFARHMHSAVRATRHRDGTSFFVDLPVSCQTTIWSYLS